MRTTIVLVFVSLFLTTLAGASRRGDARRAANTPDLATPCESDRDARVKRDADYLVLENERVAAEEWAETHCKIVDDRQSVPFVYRDVASGVLFSRYRWVGKHELKCNGPRPKLLGSWWGLRPKKEAMRYNRWWAADPRQLTVAEMKRNRACGVLDEPVLGESLCSDVDCFANEDDE